MTSRHYLEISQLCQMKIISDYNANQTSSQMYNRDLEFIQILLSFYFMWKRNTFHSTYIIKCKCMLKKLIIMKNTYPDGLLLFGNLFLPISVLIFNCRLEMISTANSFYEICIRVGIDNLFSFSCTERWIITSFWKLSEAIRVLLTFYFVFIDFNIVS